MLCINNSISNEPETNYKEKVRCGEIYRNLNGNHMFQKFYYRCLECSMDFESSSDFEEHVIGHYLLEDDIIPIDDGEENANHNERNVIDISSDDEDNAYLCAVEVTAVDETISASDLPLSLMQMLGQTNASQRPIQPVPMPDEDISGSDSNEKTFPCKGLFNRSLHPFSDDPDRCCPSCPGYFNSDHELDEHKIVHTLPNTVMCPYCYEVFANVIKLQQHTRIRRKKNSKAATKKQIENNKGPKKRAISQSKDAPVKMDTGETDMDEKGKEPEVAPQLMSNNVDATTESTTPDNSTSNKDSTSTSNTDNGSTEVNDKKP